MWQEWEPIYLDHVQKTRVPLVIGAVAFAANLEALLFPILISAVGIPISLITMFSARVKEEKDVAPALKKTFNCFYRIECTGDVICFTLGPTRVI